MDELIFLRNCIECNINIFQMFLTTAEEQRCLTIIKEMIEYGIIENVLQIKKELSTLVLEAALNKPNEMKIIALRIVMFINNQ